MDPNVGPQKRQRNTKSTKKSRVIVVVIVVVVIVVIIVVYALKAPFKQKITTAPTWSVERKI